METNESIIEETYGSSPSNPLNTSSSKSTSSSSSVMSPHTAGTASILGPKTHFKKKKSFVKKFFSYAITQTVVLQKRIIKKVKYLMASFLYPENMKIALKIPIVFGNKNLPNVITFQKLEEIKPPISELTQNDFKNRTIQVIDILLNLKAAFVRVRFKQYGKITCLTMRTRGLFQHAFIEYSSPDGILHFKSTSWSNTLGQNIVRVLPLSLSQEEHEKRQLYCFKLADLPLNTQVLDIIKYIVSIGGKTCFISCNPNNFTET
ncbi:hypothetical protein C1645_737434 [Glomus cerebriforme]|uniref:Uncharacterized protein n=1 Tax=Glomus cerebriforme TaxID=658196 RepID=A0A397T7F8_9GLOM|nr:hypothetical protein C1645_737434 [Glomus cerebriforme]